MRRRSKTPTPEESVRAFVELLRSGEGLRRLLALMPPGSTLDDALRLHERTKQRFRRPCSFLDRELGIRRDSR